MDNIDIKTPEDILKYMDNIRYGYLDFNKEEHVGTLKGFRKTYRTMSVEETLDHKLGTCIEQVYLMHLLLDKIGLKNKMFCTRIYENGDIDDEEDEHMHCFVLYYDDAGVHQIEHPNWERVGIYHFKTEDEAIKKINKIYVEMANGVNRPVTEFFDVEPGLSFKEFNGYINSLDDIKGEKNENTKL